MFNRNDAFSIKINSGGDGGDGGDESPITKTLNIDGDLFLFKTDSIYQMLTAETIDPNETDLSTRHSYKKIYSVGTKSLFISRIIIQFYEILPVLNNDLDISQDKIITYIWNTNKLIIDCLLIFQSINNETSNLIKECDNIITNYKNNTVIPPLPQVAELEKHVGTFFNKAKLFLMQSFNIFKIFFDKTFNDENSSNFDKHLKCLNEKLGDKHPIVTTLKYDINWIRLISKIRNAFEHPKDGQRIKVRNFELQPGNKFSVPTYSFDLTKKLKKKKDNICLITDLNTMLNNMLYFFEEILLLSIQDKLKNNDLLELGKIREIDINHQCPIAYKLSPKSSFLNTIE